MQIRLPKWHCAKKKKKKIRIYFALFTIVSLINYLFTAQFSEEKNECEHSGKIGEL